MSEITKSEELFKLFCEQNKLICEKVAETNTPTPDYLVSFNEQRMYVEVKQIDKDADFDRLGGGGSRTVGGHVRQKITNSKTQIQTGAVRGMPSILLVYNNLDPIQLFGTEQHDFIAAMYGEKTVVLKSGRIIDSYHGRQASFRHDHNMSFSGVGHLRNSGSSVNVRLYENAYARHSLRDLCIPSCFEIIYVEIEGHVA